MNPFTVVIPNHDPELAVELIESIRRTHTRMPRIIVVADGHSRHFGPDVLTLSSVFPEFVFARNVNMGIKATIASHRDAILINDDCVMTQPDCLFKLATLATKVPKLGIMAPRIDGGVGQAVQSANQPWNKEWDQVVTLGGDAPVCFICVWISYEMIKDIGPLDENFIGYGFDDNDYCLRARTAGWLTCISRDLVVKHGSGGAELKRGENWSVSFSKKEGVLSNLQYFLKKHPPAVTCLPPL